MIANSRRLIVLMAWGLVLALGACATDPATPVGAGRAGGSLAWRLQSGVVTSNTLSDIWCFPSGRYYAVGIWDIVYFDGTSTHVFDLDAEILRGVYATSETDVYFCGFRVFHYDGNNSTPLYESPEILYAISGAEGHLFAVGNVGTVAHFDGVSWSSTQVDASVLFYDVWAFAADNVYAAASNGVYHYDGNTWTLVNTGHPSGFGGVWGRGPSDVYAVGYPDAFYHYDGSQWTNLVTPGNNYAYHAVWGNSGTNVFAAGEQNRGDNDAIVARYDGTNVYTSNVFKGHSTVLLGVGGFPNGEALAVGTRGMMFRYRDFQWERVNDFFDTTLQTVAVISATDAFAGGTDSRIYHYDGTDWTVTDDPPDFLNAIYAIASDDLWVASRGRVRHYDGSVWTDMDLATGLDLRDVWAASPQNVFAVGDRQEIHRYDGSQWERLTPTPASINSLRGVWGSSEFNVFAVGENGTILHYSGVNWQAMASGTQASLSDVWGSGAGDVFAVGGTLQSPQSSEILHYNGTTWIRMPLAADLAANDVINSVWGAGPADVYAASSRGGLLHYDGVSWTRMDIGPRPGLVAVHGSSFDNIFAVGRMGTFIHYGHNQEING